MTEKEAVPRGVPPSSNGTVVPRFAERNGVRGDLVNRRVVVLTQELRITPCNPMLELRDVSLGEEEEPFE